MPIEAVHGAAGLPLARDELLLRPKQAVWPANLPLRECALQVLQAKRCATPLPDAVVSIAQLVVLYVQRMWPKCRHAQVEGTPANP